MKLKNLFKEIDRWNEQKLSSDERDFSEGNIKVGDFLSMLDKMYELMKMAEDADINDYNKEKGEIEVMKRIINDVFSNERIKD